MSSKAAAAAEAAGIGGADSDVLLDAVRDPWADPIPTLLDALRSPNAAVRSQAALLLREVPSPRAAGPLSEALTGDPEESVRAEAAETLGMLGAVNGLAASALVAATRDPSDLVRVCAAEALGGAARDTPGARDALVRLLDDDNSLVRLYAVEALGYLGDTGVVPLLYEKLPGDWPEVRVWYRFALLQLGEPFDFGDVQNILRRGGYTARIQAATVLRLSATGDETEARAVAALQRALRRERHPAAREHIGRLLRDLGAEAPGDEQAAPKQ